MKDSPPTSRQPYAEARVGPNRVALLKDGYQAFPAMLAAIASARLSVCLETYILKDDELGLRFLGALIERAPGRRRGAVDVRLLGQRGR